MGEEAGSAALRTRSTRPKLPGLSDRLRVVRLEGDEDVDPLLVAFLRAQEAAAEAEAAIRLANKVRNSLTCHAHQAFVFYWTVDSSGVESKDLRRDILTRNRKVCTRDRLDEFAYGCLFSKQELA